MYVYNKDKNKYIFTTTDELYFTPLEVNNFIIHFSQLK